VLASTLIEHCRNLPSAKVVFFYSKYKDPNRDNLVSILRAIIAQLIRLKPDLLPYLFETAMASGKISLDDDELALQLVDEILASFTEPIYLILDGLDECSRSAKSPVVRFCRSFVDRTHQTASCNLRCCIFSQDDTDTGLLLKTVPTLQMTSRHNKQDIVDFCKFRSSGIQDTFELSDEEVEKLIGNVSTNADGNGLRLYHSLR
jgi:hypothetical protein